MELNTVHDVSLKFPENSSGPSGHVEEKNTSTFNGRVIQVSQAGVQKGLQQQVERITRAINNFSDKLDLQREATANIRQAIEAKKVEHVNQWLSSLKQAFLTSLTTSFVTTPEEAIHFQGAWDKAVQDIKNSVSYHFFQNDEDLNELLNSMEHEKELQLAIESYSKQKMQLEKLLRSPTVLEETIPLNIQQKNSNRSYGSLS